MVRPCSKKVGELGSFLVLTFNHVLLLCANKNHCLAALDPMKNTSMALENTGSATCPSRQPRYLEST